MTISPTGLSDLNGSLTFNENHLQVESLSARTGGGTLNATGSISYYQRQVIFDLKGTAQEVRLRYPPGISSTTNADVRFTGTNASSTPSGELTVMKLRHDARVRLRLLPGTGEASHHRARKLPAR